MGADNHEHPVFVIHRAYFGSFERFIGILIEHYAGAFPFWLAPVQIRFVPVSDDHAERAEAVAARIREAGYRVEVDSSDETVGKRIRNTQVEKIPFTVVFGERESEASLAVRERGGEQSNPSLAEFLETLASLRDEAR
jgi:threonyl-tRNA synthetase